MRQTRSQLERPRDLGLAALALLLLSFSAACGNDRRAPLDREDAGFDGPVASDAAVDGAPAFSVDFVVQGCSSGSIHGVSCRGAAPLALIFAPVVTGEFSRFFWDFGDGSPPSAMETPAHVYETPGHYDVGLVVGGPLGSLSRSHAGFVIVGPSGPGATCVRDEQCGTGLHCLCASATDGCGPAFTRGICTRSCLGTPRAGLGGDGSSDAFVDGGPDSSPAGADDCGPRAICVDLSVQSASTAAPWQAPICLIHCARNADCPTGLACRRLPGGPASTGDWPLACFPSAPRDVGAPCRDANGALDDSACTGGVCADLGAFGMCSADCSSAACPAGSHCATFANARHLCLPGCSAQAADGGADAGLASSANGCASSDPLLACIAPGPRGPLGFSLANDGAAGARVCAPRSCSTNSDCAPSGRCLTGDAGEGACAWPREPSLTDAGVGRDEAGPRDAPPDGIFSDGASADAPFVDAPFVDATTSDSSATDGAHDLLSIEGGYGGAGGNAGTGGNVGSAGGRAGSANDAGAEDVLSHDDGPAWSSDDASASASDTSAPD